eukprot:GHVS01081148.1.p1 GENE.GHVS01081148.1~~GHVS01081148.1.p1  ORF type:complete len:280 (+),score=26.07 GHVS01081148.1:236-1075(+)
MACVNRIVYGRSNGVAVLLAVAAVVLLSISHSRACQSSIDNPKGCEADAPQNGVKMTTTECIEMTQAQSSEGEYAESSEGEYGESDRSEPEDLAKGKDEQRPVQWAPERQLLEAAKGLEYGHSKSDGDLRKKDVVAFLTEYMRRYDENIVFYVDVFFNPRASMHIIGPFVPQDSKPPILWTEHHMAGSAIIKEAMEGVNFGFKTEYEFVSLKPAQAMSMYVVVQGTRKSPPYPPLTFVQEFLVQRDYWCPFRMRIWYTTFTGLVSHEGAEKRSVADTEI